MTKKLKKKTVVCYICEKKKGIAIRHSKTIEEKKAVMNVEKGKAIQTFTGNLKKVYYWEAKGFQFLGPDRFLCNACAKHRCRRCSILLSNTKKCTVCEQYHGAFYDEHPNYCKECWDSIEASQKNDSK